MPPTLDRTLEILHEGIHQRLHIGAQLFASIDGQPVADLALGLARLAPDSPTGHDIPMQTDTLMLWLSAGKPLTAAAICMLWERGQLQFEDTVVQHWPDFGKNGKQDITIRHLLTHTSGIRGTDLDYPFKSWDETLARIADMKLERDWIPGQRAGYHTHTSWYILGELIRRITGQMPDPWIRDNLLLPLGMTDTFLSLTPDQYASYGPRIGFLYDTSSLKTQDAELTPPSPLPNYDTPLAAFRPRPSASARGPIRQLARLYDMLRRGGELDGIRLLKPETVHAMTMRQRVGMFDQTFRATLDWGLGIIINSSHYGGGIPYQFGPHASRETFGHGGSQSSTAFCDPRHQLVVSLLFNGCPGEPAHDKRLRATLKALYEDLALASSP
jgi:CubicO group peptidase (beta-lactamase class C family)